MADQDNPTPEETTAEASTEATAKDAAKDVAKPTAKAAAKAAPADTAPDADEDDDEAAEESSQPTAADLLAPDEAGDDTPRRRIKGKFIPRGVVHITATFNNTQVAVSDPQGNVISWSSAGRAGFKGSRKSTAFAASSVASQAAKAALAYGMQEVEVRVQGPGAGRESAIRAVQAAGLNVTSIRDTTPVPHNGCRPRKRRRV